MVIEDDIGDWEFSQYNDPILVLSANIIILRKALCDIIVKITLNSTAFNVEVQNKLENFILISEELILSYNENLQKMSLSYHQKQGKYNFRKKIFC